MYQRGTITDMSVGTYHVRYSLQAVRKMYSGTGTLVPRAPYFRTEQAPVDVRGGQWQLYSCQTIPDVAVEGARRGSRIWLRLGGDLHRLSWRYEMSRAG